MKNNTLKEIKYLLELGSYNAYLLKESPSAKEDYEKIEAFLKSDELEILDNILNNS